MILAAIKEKIKAILQVTSSEKWLKLGKLTTITGFAQVAVQGIGFLCGILIIRILPTEEYALYTLANTILGTMTVLADSGISSGVMAEGGKVWEDKNRLGAVITTGIYLRKRFAVGSLLITTPILFYLLQHHGASWLTSTLILLSLIPAFFAALSGRILEIVPKLHQDIIKLQKIQIASNIGRLILLVLTIFVFPLTYVVIFAASLPQVWANFQLRKRATEFINAKQKKTKAIQTRIMTLVKRTMPGAIYYAFAGQIMVWLISIFGNTENIAQIGALSRLTALLGIIQSVLSVLVVPYFSKNQAAYKKSILLFLLLQVGLILFTVLLSFLVWLFPTLLLSILGSQYNDLSYELLLMIISACIGLQGGIAYHISASVGIVPSPVWVISYMLFMQIVFIFVFDFRFMEQVILYSIFVNIAALLYQAIYFLKITYYRHQESYSA